FEELFISDTLCDPTVVEAMKPLTVDEPTVSMTFQVNDSPFCGKEGKFVTSRNIKDRLDKELLYNVALRVEEGDSADKFKVSGRGELHLSVLIETMRREGFELALGRPEVIIREVDGVKQEPYENVTIDIPEESQGKVMEEMGLPGLRPIVVINKVDRPGARPDWVLDQIFDLFDNLGATEEQLDFQVVYASAINGIAGLDHNEMAEDMTPLYQAVVDHVPAPKVDRDGPFQMQISALDYNSFLGVIGVGRIARGRVKP
nr:GTP binding protein TypA [Tanacetum cinerariifolium]